MQSMDSNLIDSKRQGACYIYCINQELCDLHIYTLNRVSPIKLVMQLQMRELERMFDEVHYYEVDKLENAGIIKGFDYYLFLVIKKLGVASEKSNAFNEMKNGCTEARELALS
uniref:Uncharacterized protein n=1 Tax=Populus trichocarpa TaxID=3694 RepID=A0A2K1Z5N7_POPTR